MLRVLVGKTTRSVPSCKTWAGYLALVDLSAGGAITIVHIWGMESGKGVRLRGLWQYASTNPSTTLDQQTPPRFIFGVKHRGSSFIFGRPWLLFNCTYLADKMTWRLDMSRCIATSKVQVVGM